MLNESLELGSEQGLTTERTSPRPGRTAWGGAILGGGGGVRIR